MHAIKIANAYEEIADVSRGGRFLSRNRPPRRAYEQKMNVQVSGFKTRRLILGMRQFITAAITLLLRGVYVLVAAIWIATAAVVALWGMEALNHTSYRFVLAFIMIILLSNILAKLVAAYIEA